MVNCGDIEADTGVVDIISEAMMHMLRNAVDHGIEAPEERAAAGKDRKGKITFTVESTVGELIVSLDVYKRQERAADDIRGPSKVLFNQPF